MAITAKITSKGQLTLPKEVRKSLNVHKGSVVVFERYDDQFLIKTARTLKEFKGILKGRSKITDIDEMRRKAKEFVGKKVAQSGRD